MEKRMASELMAMEERLMEQQIKHQEKMHLYKERIEMIKDVLKGDEAPDLKVKLIQEVISIGL
jgi:hypothetical protein